VQVSRSTITTVLDHDHQFRVWILRRSDWIASVYDSMDSIRFSFVLGFSVANKFELQSATTDIQSVLGHKLLPAEKLCCA